MCAWEFPAHSQQVPWWECVAEGMVSSRVNRPALLVLCIGPCTHRALPRGFKGLMWDKSPIRPFQNQLSSHSCPTQKKELQHPPWNQRKVSWGKEIWRSLIQVPAQSRTHFNIGSACSVKIWKSPKTMILQPVLAPFPVLIHPHYENVFLLCPTKYSGSPKLLHTQPQRCWVEGNNNLLWPAIYTLIIAARYAFSPPCCKGMLPCSFSIFAHWEPLVFFRATPQPASLHPSVLHRDNFKRWKTLHLSLLNFLKFCHPIFPCP